MSPGPYGFPRSRERRWSDVQVGNGLANSDSRRAAVAPFTTMKTAPMVLVGAAGGAVVGAAPRCEAFGTMAGFSGATAIRGGTFVAGRDSYGYRPGATLEPLYVIRFPWIPAFAGKTMEQTVG